MDNVRILDCTLRDGARLIDCELTDFHISGIVNGLTDSGIDIIEMGFLRNKISYSEGTTLFTAFDQISKFIPQNAETMYVLFMDYGMVGMDQIPQCTGTGITGIRFAYRKKDFEAALPCLYDIKSKGYKLFVQTVESKSYTQEELEDAISKINALKPYSFGIVDTFGAMYKKDVIEFYNFIDSRLDEDICICFHSHNNMQLSFAHAQEVVEQAQTHARARASERSLIIDATLEGIGKGAGNLNTELIADFLNKDSYKYDPDTILDTIDRHIFWIKSKERWGYSIPSYLSGVYNSHPNNVAYLINMHKLQTKDIGYILSMIDPETRKFYDYGNIDRKYLEYFDSKFDDASTLQILKEKIGSKGVLVVVFGASIKKHEAQLKALTQDKENTVTISVNFKYDESTDFIFYGNQRRYTEQKEAVKHSAKIITSNLKPEDSEGPGEPADLIVNFNKLVDRELENFDNSTIMLLNLLRNIGVTDIKIAGLDGYDLVDTNKSVFSKDFSYNINPRESEHRNEVIGNLLRHFAKSLNAAHKVTFITPSRFENIFKPEGRKIKMLIMDVDGTLTDGKIYIGNSGEIMKAFSVKDGHCLISLRENGIEPVIITGRKSDIVANRAKELGIREVYQAAGDKKSIVHNLCSKYSITLEEAAFIGDDANDIEAMKICGFKACPANAIPAVRALCDYISKYNSGEGAVRDIFAYIMNIQGDADVSKPAY